MLKTGLLQALSAARFHPDIFYLLLPSFDGLVNQKILRRPSRHVTALSKAEISLLTRGEAAFARPSLCSAHPLHQGGCALAQHVVIVPPFKKGETAGPAGIGGRPHQGADSSVILSGQQAAPILKMVVKSG